MVTPNGNKAEPHNLSGGKWTVGYPSVRCWWTSIQSDVLTSTKYKWHSSGPLRMGCPMLEGRLPWDNCLLGVYDCSKIFPLLPQSLYYIHCILCWTYKRPAGGCLHCCQIHPGTRRVSRSNLLHAHRTAMRLSGDLMSVKSLVPTR